jgi:hypothetical protein
MFQICGDIWNNKNDKFIDFLIKNNAINKSLVRKTSYNSDKDHVIDLGNNDITNINTIYLSDSSETVNSTESIVRGQTQDIL